MKVKMKRLAKSPFSLLCQECRRPESSTRLFSSATAMKSPSSSSSSSSSPFPQLQSRPAKLIPDYLTPMSSHLLTTTLSDLHCAPLPSTSSPIIHSPAQVLPQGHHLVYFPIQTPPSRLAPDGADPDHSPGAAYPRRMWAGGEVIFHPGWDKNLVLDGRPWRCQEDIGEVDVRATRGEERIFVDVWRRYGLGHAHAQVKDGEGTRTWDIEERRTLVFMREGDGSFGREGERRVIKAPRSNPAKTNTNLVSAKAPYKPSYSSAVTPSAKHLFHFSALTFNAHSIHFDPLYTRFTEKHDALLVHGPLTLALMLHELRGTVAHISYRNYAPLYVDDSLRVCVRERSREGLPWDVWVEGPEGGMAVRGTAVMAR
ncbi:hypothetical protein E4U21_003890 [Claviceps maximensis]|nr:hypothetical protein E4U21_003890 [Claviceps maximensis]